METIKEAKQHLRANFKHKGTNCPCCGQFVKLYKRKLGSVMARTLIQLYKMDKEFNHVREIVKGISETGTNDFSKLAYWGLIDEMSNDSLAKRTSGFWRITPKGRQFVERKITVNQYALIYNRLCEGFSVETINISEALGKKFNYNELMTNN